MVTLFYAVTSCAEACFIAAFRAGLVNMETVHVDLDTHKTQHGVDFYTINPFGKVPVLLLDDGSTLLETAAILQFIADQVRFPKLAVCRFLLLLVYLIPQKPQNPAAELAPENRSLDRYKLQDALNFIASEIHATFVPVFHSDVPQVKEWSFERLAVKFRFLETVLLKDKRFLVREKLSVADIYLYEVVSWSFLCDFDLSPYPAVLAHFERVKNIDTIIAAHNRMKDKPPHI